MNTLGITDNNDKTITLLWIADNELWIKTKISNNWWTVYKHGDEENAHFVDDEGNKID